MLSELLDVSRLDTEQLVLNLQSVSLTALLHDLVEDMQVAAPYHTLHLAPALEP